MSRFIIKKNINILSKSEYVFELNTDCTICRCNLNDSSISNNNKELNITKGQCGHAFHTECINPWLNRVKVCPICICNWI